MRERLELARFLSVVENDLVRNCHVTEMHLDILTLKLQLHPKKNAEVVVGRLSVGSR